jgi:hypothetical protein
VTGGPARAYLSPVNKPRIAIAAGVILAGMQLVPVSRTNPPVESTVPAPPEVLRILRKACFDCHSHETVWAAPQSWVAPVSWLVAHDVSEGREEMNLSRWKDLSPKSLAKIARKLPEEVGEGGMPPAIYRLAHPEARLTDAEKATLSGWARGLADGGTR